MKVINTTRFNPDTQTHYIGERLETNSPEAWTNTTAFYGRMPTQEEVNSHMEYCVKSGLATKDGESYHFNDNRVPVVYEFGIRWDDATDLQPANTTKKAFEGHYYNVTDEAITPTGKVETYIAESRTNAVLMALYTHRLHNGNAQAHPRGVIHCPSCGQIAIVSKPDQTTQPTQPSLL